MSNLSPLSRRVTWLAIAFVISATAAWFFWTDISRSYHGLRVRSAFRQRDWLAALAALDAYPQKAKQTAEWHYLRARAARRSGDLPLAAESLERAEAQHWNSRDIAREKILLKAQAGNFREIEQKLHQLTLAENADEQAEEIYEATARGFMTSLRFEDAIQCLKFWSKWQVDNPLPHLWLGQLYVRAEDPQSAATEFQGILERNPRHLEARLKLARLRLSEFEVDKAAELFEQCRLQDPDSSPALLGLAECRRRQGKHEEALRLFRSALTLELSPEQQAAALGGLGEMAVESGEYSRAVQLLQEALQQNPHDPALHLALAAALLALGERESAAEQREIAKSISNRHAKIVGITRQLIQEPNNVDLRCQAGVILLEEGFNSDAAQWLQSAIQLNPNYVPAHEGLARFFRVVGDAKRAVEHEQMVARLKALSGSGQSGDEVP